jgi:hypothetical protein
MKLITLPRLRLTQLQAIAETTLTICKDLPQLVSEVLGVENVFNPFKAGMLKDKVSAEEKGKLDQVRDQRVTGFFAVLYAEEKIENDDPAILASYTALLKIANKYGQNIRRLPREEETAAIDNLLAEIAKINISPLIPTGIPRWIPSLAAANKAYKIASAQFISDNTDAKATEAAGLLAPRLVDALEELYTNLFAVIRLTPSDELKKAYAALEILVDSVR